MTGKSTATVLLAATLVLVSFSCSRSLVRVACVGDSITYGHGIRDREHDTYPALLDSLLGDRYDVRNFGISGRTLMNSGDFPYMSEQVYRDAVAFQPDIVTIKLGTNDSKPQNWIHGEDFRNDLKILTESFRGLSTKPRIIVCLPVPAMGNAWDINDSIISSCIIPCIREVAEEEGLELVDLNTPFKSQRQYFPDTIHPNEKGQRIIAGILYDVISGKKSGRTRH